MALIPSPTGIPATTALPKQEPIVEKPVIPAKIAPETVKSAPTKKQGK